MASRPDRLPALASFMAERPLRPVELVLLGSFMVLGGTVYCVVYCLIAFAPMHGHAMPLSYSAAWAIFTFLPWLGAIEWAKRGSDGEGRPAWYARCIILLTGAFASSIAIELLADLAFGVETRPLTMQAADRLAPLSIIAALLWTLDRRRSPEGRGPAATGNDCPLEGEVCWMRAAGNYVEFRSGDRLHIRRLTMRELESQLDPRLFVRIHRSVIVNRDEVAAIGPERQVRMRDGTEFRVGHAYRRSLDRLS